jgi:hypothetical protein
VPRQQRKTAGRRPHLKAPGLESLAMGDETLENRFPPAGQDQRILGPPRLLVPISGDRGLTGRPHSAQPPTPWRRKGGLAVFRRSIHLAATKGMTVVDRPTISVQFFGSFYAHGLPIKLKVPSMYRYFGPSPRRACRSAPSKTARQKILKGERRFQT